MICTIMSTHSPNWTNIQQLMATMFNPEEREKIRRAVSEILKESLSSDQSMETHLEHRYPSEDPEWEPQHDKALLRAYRELVVKAIGAAGKPPTNMSKLSLVLQNPDEAPEAFYTRLLDAYRMYMPVDPEAPENARMIVMAFISQSTPDIMKKLQRQEKALGISMSELIEIAPKTYVNRDKEEEKKREQRMKQKANFLATALTQQRGGGGRGGTRERERPKARKKPTGSQSMQDMFPVPTLEK